MAFSSGVVGGDELHAHGFGLLGEVMQDPLAVALLEVILPPVGVFLPVGEHGVDQSGQLMGSGRDGLGFVHARAHSPVVAPSADWLERSAAAANRNAWAARLSASVWVRLAEYIPPAEAEANYYRQLASQVTTVAA